MNSELGLTALTRVLTAWEKKCTSEMEPQMDKNLYYQHTLFKLDKWLHRTVFVQWKAVSSNTFPLVKSLQEK